LCSGRKYPEARRTSLGLGTQDGCTPLPTRCPRSVEEEDLWTMKRQNPGDDMKEYN
jgi:hypothetical protein